MITETVPYGSITPLEQNPRRHPEKQMAELVRSVKQFGQYRALVVDEVGTILAGNGLYRAMGECGYTEVVIHRKVGLTESQKKKLVLTDNRVGELASDDFEVIDAMLRSLDDLDVPGYDSDMLATLLDDTAAVAAAEQYGRLSADVVDRLNDRTGSIAEANAQSTTAQERTGAPPAGERPDVSGSTCPTCHRPW